MIILNKDHIKSPVEIVNTQLGIPQEYKQQCIKETYRLSDSMNQETNVKAIMSSYWVWKETKIFNLLLDKIIEVVYASYPILTEGWEYKIFNSWSSIYKKGHYTIPHHHKPSYISFVYYLQSTGTTPLVFDECNFKINPVDDMLIMFPSHINHSVPKHIDEEDRICIAGNLNIMLKPEQYHLYYNNHSK